MEHARAVLCYHISYYSHLIDTLHGGEKRIFHLFLIAVYYESTKTSNLPVYARSLGDFLWRKQIERERVERVSSEYRGKPCSGSACFLALFSDGGHLPNPTCPSNQWWQLTGKLFQLGFSLFPSPSHSLTVATVNLSNQVSLYILSDRAMLAWPDSELHTCGGQNIGLGHLNILYTTWNMNGKCWQFDTDTDGLTSIRVYCVIQSNHKLLSLTKSKGKQRGCNGIQYPAIYTQYTRIDIHTVHVHVHQPVGHTSTIYGTYKTDATVSHTLVYKTANSWWFYVYFKTVNAGMFTVTSHYVSFCTN